MVVPARVSRLEALRVAQPRAFIVVYDDGNNEQGGGSMPSFRKTLTAPQIRDVAAFVASHAGQAR